MGEGMAGATMTKGTVSAGAAVGLRRHLFYETSHSPALTDLVGYENAKDIIDFCFIANPYYPTAAMMEELQRSLPNLIKSYPSSNPLTCQRYLAEVLEVDAERIVIGNGATELIALITQTLIDRIAVPVPTFGEYIEKMRDSRNAELYPLRADDRYLLHLDDYLEWADQRKLECVLVINPGNPTGQFIPLKEMAEFLHEARHLELVIVDESFIGFAGEEEGMVGSEFYVKQLTPEERKQIAAMVNLECLGIGKTEVWTSHSDVNFIHMLMAMAQSLNLPLAGVNVERVGTTDSESFSHYGIPRMTITAITQDTWPLLHSKNDNIKAIKPELYYDSYRLIVPYLVLLDQQLPVSPAMNSK